MIFLMFLLLISFVYAESTFKIVETVVTQTKHYDQFDYSDNVENHNWIHSGSGCTINFGNTLPSAFGTYAMGANGVTTCTTFGYTSVQTTTYGSNTYIFEMDIAVLRDEDKSGYDSEFTVRTGINGTGSVIFYTKINGSKGIDMYGVGSGFETCLLSNVFMGEENYLLHLVIELNLNTMEYSVFTGDRYSNCVNKKLRDDGVTSKIGSFVYLFPNPDEEIFHKYIDNFHFYRGQVIKTEECDFPTLFCDDFNYDNPLVVNQWYIRNNDYSINETLTPLNDKLTLTQDNVFISAEHTTSSFPVDYRTSATTRRTISKYSPMFASQFILNFANSTDNVMEYEASSEQNKGGYVLRAELDDTGNSSGNMNWFYLNNSVSGFEYILLCGNCTLTDTDLNVKIISYFTHRDIFPFNATIGNDKITVYINNILIGEFNNFITNIDYLGYYVITKFPKGDFTIDDYYVMVGADRLVDLSVLAYFDYYDNETAEDTDIVVGGSTEDLAVSLLTIWDDMGLQSTTSRIMAGLFLMFILAMVMFGMALTTGHPLNPMVLIVVELFFMILLTFIRLLPIWIPIIIVLIGVGIGAYTMKTAVHT